MLPDNPFYHGNPVPPKQLIGRDNDLTHLVGRIITGQSSAIIGPFRCGKTSILDYLMDPQKRTTLYGEKAEKMLFSYLDAYILREQLNQAEFWNQVLAPLHEQVVVHNLVPSLSKAYQICQENQFGNFVLQKLIAQMEQVNWRLVLMLDRFDLLLHYPVLNSTEFFGGLRTLASRSNGALTLVTTANTSLAQLNQDSQQFYRTGSPYFNFLDEIMLGPLSILEVDSLLNLGRERFSDADCRFIVEMAGGYPYLLQVAASVFWQLYQTNRGRQQVGQDFYLKVRGTLRDTWNYSWPPNLRKVFTTIALAHMNTLPITFGLKGKDAETIISPLQELNVQKLVGELPLFAQEVHELEKYGFIRADENIPGGWRVYPLIFLWFVADKLEQEVRDERVNDSSYKKWLTGQSHPVENSSNHLGNWVGALIIAVSEGFFRAYGH
jgi:hypothetical protein